MLGASYYTIPGSVFLTKIRTTVQTLGYEKLGFHPEDVGTHSNHLGEAMGISLAGTPVYNIMLMGRWSSDTFMRYIHKQVLSFIYGIAAKMPMRNSTQFLILFIPLQMVIFVAAAVPTLLQPKVLMAHTRI